jgi:membrane-bound lytic murein transglycosylase MltF
MRVSRYFSFLLLALAVGACSGSSDKTKSPASDSATAAVSDVPAYESALPPEMRAKLDQPFKGDLNEMIKRRVIRVGVPFNRTFYFIDKGRQRGLSYEYMTLYEDELNKRMHTGNLKIHVVPLPTPRDMLLPALRDGKVDMVVAQLTVTPERQAIVDFTNPTRPNINEVVVTPANAAPVNTPQDLSGKTVFVRKTSSYYSSLQTLNAKLKAAGRKPVDIRAAPESLEDDDLLEMVNAGLLPATVVDDYLANYWKQVFPNLKINASAPLRTGGNLAVAIRKNSPELAASLNDFIAKFGLESTIGRVLNQRYLQSTTYVKDASSEAERRKFLAMVDLFRRYGDQYKFDYLMMAAQGYQESRLDMDAKSHVGAIGVMQVMPSTGAEQEVGDIRQLEPNIHAGVKYMRFMRDRYFAGEPMDPLNKALFTFASYNAGPGRIRQLRKIAQERGLNPNVWFGNVEQVASEQIGRETPTYVSNIYKYYIAYGLIVESRKRTAEAKASLAKQKR